MIDQLITIGLSNTCFALLLAIVAMFVGAKAERPQLAHLLWILVLVKLVTPPLVSIPVNLFLTPLESTLMQVPLDASVSDATFAEAREDSLLPFTFRVWRWATPWFGIVWLSGSGVVLVWSLVRVFQFNRLLRTHTDNGPKELLAATADLAQRLELKTVPDVSTTTANISPMVWWTGGRVRVIIPSSLLRQLEPRQWRWVLAHELVHVRRRDHLVRWLEWLAQVGFWWNPIVWWAQRNLRAMEEICCDALVISKLKPEPHTYANSILTAVESLARPILRPPAMASEINSGGFLERRFKMMISNSVKRSNSRWLQACVLLCSLIVLPLGVVYAHDVEAVGKRLKIAVEAGELSGEQARAMLGTLKKLGSVKSTAKKDHGSERAKAYLMGVKKKLGAQIEAGEISKEDAAKRYEGAEKAIKARMAAGHSKAAAKHITHEQFDRVVAQIKKAVDEGNLSEKEARSKLAATRKMIAEHGKRAHGGDARPDWEGIQKRIERIEGAVKRGDITRKEADAKYKKIKKYMKAKSQENESQKKKNKSRKKKSDKPDWESIKRRIEGAVKRGDMTREEADTAYRIKYRLQKE